MKLSPGLVKIKGSKETWIVWEDKLVLLESLFRMSEDGSYRVPFIDSLILVNFRKKGVAPIRVTLYENNSGHLHNMTPIQFATFALQRKIDTSAIIAAGITFE